MITSIHNLIYSDDAQATRAFLRDVLGWEYVAEDFGNDWLIFKSGPSEMGVHQLAPNEKEKPTIIRDIT